MHYRHSSMALASTLHRLAQQGGAAQICSSQRVSACLDALSPGRISGYSDEKAERCLAASPLRRLLLQTGDDSGSCSPREAGFLSNPTTTRAQRAFKAALVEVSAPPLHRLTRLWPPNPHKLQSQQRRTKPPHGSRNVAVVIQLHRIHLLHFHMLSIITQQNKT